MLLSVTFIGISYLAQFFTSDVFCLIDMLNVELAADILATLQESKGDSAMVFLEDILIILFQQKCQAGDEKENNFWYYAHYIRLKRLKSEMCSVWYCKLYQ